MRTWLALTLVAASACACTRGARAQRWRPIPEVPDSVVEAGMVRLTAPEPAPADVGPAPDQIPGTPPIRVVWEQLARSRPGGTKLGQRVGIPDALRLPPAEPKIVLLNASHPEAVKMRRRAAEGRSQRWEAELAIVSDEDALALVEDLERLGLFDHARPTDAVEPNFKSAQARGRITVDRSGESVTLLALYGQGRQDSTKAIPGIYASAKNLVAVLKNRTPHLSVTSFGTEKPPAPPKPTTPPNPR